MLRLSDATLGQLSRRVEVPRYDRALLEPSVVHLGVGGFHRAHQALYLDEVAQLGVTGWGEVGVSLRSGSMRSTLAEQDHLFSVVQQDSGGEAVRVVGVMTDYLAGGVDREAVLARLADRRTRIVSMTITGDGYPVDADHAFQEDAPEVQRDLQRPGAPQTWMGYLTEALSQRRRAGLRGFTVLSCDNLVDSGATTRAALVGYARLRDETLARWIERHVSFPDSMVDRITPGSGDELQRTVARDFGLDDPAAVSTEPFTQWVVQDAFIQGRPPLEDVGVQVVADVAPYKLIKTRLLNGSHTALGYLGWLAGHRTTADVAADPVMHGFLAAMMMREIVPSLPLLPEMNAEAYVAQVLQRLANERIADPLTRLCRRGSTKVPAYLLPSLVEARAEGRPAPLLTLALAGWFRYLSGTDLEGRPIEVVDPRLDELQARALRCGRDPGLLLAAPALVGQLGDDPSLRREVAAALDDLETVGVHEAVRRRLLATADSVTVPRPRRAAADLRSRLIS